MICLRLIIKIFCLCFFINANVAFGQSFIESDLNYGTDLFSSHGFLINPAIYQTTSTKVDVAIVKKSGESFLSRDQNNNLSENKSQFEKNIIATSIVVDAGSGLGLGLVIQRMTYNIDSTDLNITDPVKEKHEGILGGARAVVELAQNLRVGVMFRALKSKHNIVGNIRLSNEENTEFGSTLLGTGGGLVYQTPVWGIGMSYLPPMKGKTEISGEEIIIIEPGVADIAVGYDRGQFRFGISHLRYIYKKDDRGNGSSISDNNNTSIDLFGLSANDNLLRPLEEYILGLDYVLNQKSDLKFSLVRRDSEFNFDLDSEVPGTDEDKEKFTRNEIKVELIINGPSLSFRAGVSYLDTQHDFNVNTTKFGYKTSHIGLYGALTKGI